MILYRAILSQAWKNTWRNKYLWYFGLFAALLGNGGELEIIFRGFSGDVFEGFVPSLVGIAETGIFSLGALANMGKLLVTDPFSFFVALTVLLLFAIISGFLVWMIIISQISLVYNSSRIITGKKHYFKEAINKGMKKFWPILSLNLLLKFIFYLSLVFISLPIISGISSSSLVFGNVVYAILFLFFMPIAVFLSFIIKYAVCYCVIKDSNFFTSLSSGWKLFKKNWLISIEMSFILLFINLLVGLVIIILFFVLAVPFLFILLVFSNFAMQINFWIISFAAFLLFLVVLAITGAALATFQIYSWTNLYIELVSKGGVAKIARLFEKKKA